MTKTAINAAENIDGFNFINHLSQFFFRNDEGARLREETQQLENEGARSVGYFKF